MHSSLPEDLWVHQKDGIAQALYHGSFGFFFEAGTGKTRTAIETLRHVYTKNQGIIKTLILAPDVVCPNWKIEFEKFSKIPQSEIELLNGSQKSRVEKIRNHPAKIFIANYQTLVMENAFDALKSWAPEIVIADESHRIKNYKAITTRRAILLAGNAKLRYILSGTPILQNACDIFPQFLFLDGGKTFGRNFFTFRHRYFVDRNKSIRGMNAKVTWPEWQPIKHREPELREKISTLTLSVKKSECLDLPPFIRQKICVELSLEQKKAYEEMRKYMITFIKSEACTAQMALHKALRLQQIVSGFIGNDEGEEHALGKVPRLKALEELLSDITPSNKVIVWACWKNNQHKIRDLLESMKIGFHTITGETSSNDRQEAMRALREDDNTRVILGSQGAGGIGINLTEAPISIYYSRNFSLEHDVQSEARNYRGGSEIHEKITRIDLVTPGTIDEDVLEALASKQEISEKIIFKSLEK